MSPERLFVPCIRYGKMNSFNIPCVSLLFPLAFMFIKPLVLLDTAWLHDLLVYNETFTSSPLSLTFATSPLYKLFILYSWISTRVSNTIQPIGNQLLPCRLLNLFIYISSGLFSLKRFFFFLSALLVSFNWFLNIF